VLGQTISSLWLEFEANETKDAQLVHRFECLVQALEYERSRALEFEVKKSIEGKEKPGSENKGIL
jgi:hypothetical protein